MHNAKAKFMHFIYMPIGLCAGVLNAAMANGPAERTFFIAITLAMIAALAVVPRLPRGH